MTDFDDPQHRAYHHSDPDRVQLREDDDESDGVFTVRMPIASTGEVRNEGDDALEREEIEGMGSQIEERAIGVFLDHGDNRDVSSSRYGATGKVGEWANPDLVEGDDGADLLEADARLMDPETLPGSTGSVKEALAALKAQVERGFSLSSSIGWRPDDSMPGGNDLMEASIVGIGADPRTTSEGPAAAMARAAIDARGEDVDPAALVEEFRSVVMGPDAADDDTRHLSSQQAEVAADLLAAYRAEQGDGSVANFEDWLWNVAYYDFDENEFHAAMTALQEFYRETTPLEEPVDEQFAPFLASRQDDDEDDGGGADNENAMTDAEIDSSDDGSDDDSREESDELDVQEYRESMLEMQETQTELLQDLADREDGDGDEDDEDDDEEDADEDGEQGADTSDEDDERSTEEIRAELDELRSQLDDADPADPSEQGEAADDESERDADEQDGERSEEETGADPGESLLEEMQNGR